MSKGKHGGRFARRGLKVALIAVSALVLLGGGTAYAAYRYDASAAGRILPGSGRRRRRRLGHEPRRGQGRDSEADETLEGELSVRAGNHSWTVTPAELETADIEERRRPGVSLAEDLSFFSRVVPLVAEESLVPSICRSRTTTTRSCSSWSGRDGGGPRRRCAVRPGRGRARDAPAEDRAGVKGRGLRRASAPRSRATSQMCACPSATFAPT